MNFARPVLRLVVPALLLGVPALHAQAVSTASERLQLSAFAGASGVYTGINSGRNLSITAGADLSLRRYFHVNPALEVRGTYPVDNGNVDGQRNALGGLRFTGDFARLHPYVDILFGRGEIKYSPALLSPDRTFLYTQSSSSVLSPGAGLEYDLSPHFALRADVQLQRYATPVLASGHLYSKPITGALTYRFDFNRHAIGGHR